MYKKDFILFDKIIFYLEEIIVYFWNWLYFF